MLAQDLMGWKPYTENSRFKKVHCESMYINYMWCPGFGTLQNLTTLKSWFKNVHFFFLKSRLVWFKKDLCSESKNRLPEKNALCRWISNLRSFLKRDFTVMKNQRWKSGQIMPINYLLACTLADLENSASKLTKLTPVSMSWLKLLLEAMKHWTLKLNTGYLIAKIKK